MRTNRPIEGVTEGLGVRMGWNLVAGIPYVR